LALSREKRKNFFSFQKIKLLNTDGLAVSFTYSSPFCATMCHKSRTLYVVLATVCHRSGFDRGTASQRVEPYSMGFPHVEIVKDQSSECELELIACSSKDASQSSH